MHALVVEHERALALLQHALDPALLHRVVADPQPPPPRPRRRRRARAVLVVPDGPERGAARAVAPERAREARRREAALARGRRARLAPEADVVPERVLAVVADDGGEAVERARHGVRRRRGRDRALDGHGWGWGRDWGGRLGGQLTRSGVGCEVKDLGEDDVAVIFGGVMAIVDGAVEVEGEHVWRLEQMRGKYQGQRIEALTRAIMDCLVDASLNTFSSFTPLMSSSILPSSNAAFTRSNSFLLSRARFFFDDEGSLDA